MIACTRGPPRGARPGAAGAQVPGVRGVTTPLDVANALSKSLAKRVVVAEADGAEWDLFRPLRAPCALRLHTFDDDLGKHVRAPRRAGHRVGHRVGQRRPPGQARAGPACMGWGSELASRTCRARQALRGVSLGARLGGCSRHPAGGKAVMTCPVGRHVRAVPRRRSPVSALFVFAVPAAYPPYCSMCMSTMCMSAMCMRGTKHGTYVLCVILLPQPGHAIGNLLDHSPCPARRRSGTAARTCWARRWRRALACG